MELGYSGRNTRVQKNSDRNIYLFRDDMWNVLCRLFGPRKKMRVTTWSGESNREDTPKKSEIISKK